MLDSHTIKNNAPFSQLTQERATQSNAIDIPSITLPKGGGALKGIDEKFEVNAANGTAGFSIPLPITPGRNNFAPALALSYNSGAGNSAFGLGWSLGYPMIQRRTDKRLPRYRDGRIEDVFMFSGAEDLVPYLENKDGSWEEIAYPENGNEGYAVKRYRPRVEGAFARIEKIHHPDHGTYWKVTTRDNTVTLFGRSKTARIANPEEETQIFQWLPEFSYDDKGNWIKFEYKPEDLTNVPDALFEKNRKTNLAPISNRYLKKVRYGNRRPYYADASKPYDPQAPADQEYLFELLLDYGEHDLLQPSPREMADGWSYRADAFSSYRAGFEIRTHRLCKRILMFHHFKEEDQFEGTPAETPFGENYLVRSLDLAYAPSSINGSGQAETTYLKAVTQSGYIRKSDGTYSKRSLPPLEFTYEQLHWNQTIKTISPENIANAPVGLTNQYQWVDLYNEGIAGILSEQADGWFYKSNLGGSAETGKVAFTAAQKVAPKPSFTGLSNGVMTVQDLAANGEKQIVINSDALKGYYELSKDNHWQPFQPFSQVAHIDLQNPNTRLIDLDGDGQADIFISEDSVFTWYASDGKRGHLPAEKVVRALDEERGPAMIFTDPVQSLFLADLSGDGLTDIVRIRNGEICYWANKGYGKFSAKINMANAPLFDHPDQFNPQYLQLADVSGTGASDLIYLGQNKFKAYINLSGNAWSDAHEIEPFFPIDRNTQLSVVDLLGTGTSCIVWSSDLPAYAHAPMRYIDLMDSKKPHLLVHCKNNLGKETFIEYKSSTHYYLKDKLDRKPWITKLPFPVQVISKMVVEEKITNVRFASEYHYHHGYYDHAEREFRGFGMVEQLDTEFYAVWKKNHNDTRLEPSEDLYQAPTLTKTWFHTGAFLDRERILTQFEKEYWYEIYQQRFPGEPLSVREPRLADARVVSARNLDFDINDLTSEEWREALRACKGMMLRQEVFTLDATEGDPASLRRQAKPYTVATHNCHIQVLQARSGNPYAVFMPTESEAITIAYERNEQDPRIAHSLNLKVDELGQVLEAASVVYPRQFRPDNHPIAALRDELATLSYERSGEQEAYLAGLNYLQAEQEKTLITFTQNAFTQDLEAPGLYRLRLPAATQTYEITGLTPSGVLFQLEDFAAPNGAGQRRLIEHIQTSYYNDSLRAELPQGELGRYGIPYQSYQLAYTPELLARIFGDKLPQDPIALENLLSDNDQNADGDNSYAQCRFVHRQDDNWWIRSGTAQFYLQDTESLPDVQNRFFSPQSFLDPFGSQTRVTYYKDYYLLMESATDALGNQSGVERFNFRTLSPVRMRDINDNLSEVLLDELGLVKAMALLGKGDEADNLNGLSEITSEAERAQIKTYFTLENTDALRTQARVLLQNAGARFVYDFERYQLSVQLREEQTQALPCEVVKLLPAVVGSITREQHFPQNPDSPLQLAFEYSDGMGHVAMAKAQAEPGEALTLRIAPDCSYQLDTVNTGENLRWIGNGRTVLNNKGNPVKQYEPYFSVNPFYEDAKELVERGVSPIIYYDALGRNIKTLLPDGTFSRVEFDSWQQRTFDPNDTVLDSDWYKDRIERRIDAQLLADGKDPLKEKAAAEKTAWHHNTPGRLYLDTLGRPVLSVGHNRVYERNAFGAITGARDELYSTLVELDIEGNTRKVIDAKGNAVMQYAYDLLGHRVYQNSMDAGEKWMLQNLAGNPIRHWDSKGHIFSTRYDILQRPTEIRLQTTGANAGSLIQKMVYGEGLADAKAKNLRGKAWQTYDSSGRITAAAFDFKGNILTVKRQLAAAYDAEIIDWSDGAPTNRLDRETFTQSTEYDALNRMQRLFNWHRSEDRVTVYLPTYNARGVLDSEIHISDADKAALETTGRRVTAVSQLEYNEKGQRTRMRYGNGSHTRYHYDRENFRLLQLKTTRSGVNGSLPAAPSNLSDANVLQNLYYTYDAVGNISEIEDDAFEPVFFRNQRVEPRSRYTYDALYRLEEATGRENKNFNSAPQAKEPKAEAAGFPLTSLAETDKTLRNYTQRYRYDATGNILHLRHLANGGSWTRNYQYARSSNRLLGTETGSRLDYDLYTDSPSLEIKYDYDAHGNMLNYNNTAEAYRLEWDYLDRVQQLDLGGGGRACYQYDSQKERSRKRIEKSGQTEERLYLGGMELYRRYGAGNTLVEEIETHHLFVDDQRALIVENVLRTDNRQLHTGLLDRYQYSNHLGSVGLEADGEGRLISYEEYHPYGTVAYHAANSAIKATARRYRYTGMERDEESGLNYHSARYYLPWLGRWGSCDPIGVGGGVNVFSYCKNDPINFSDVEGKQALRVSEDQLRSLSFENVQRLIVSAGGNPGPCYENPTDEQREHDLTILRNILIGGGIYIMTLPAPPDPNEEICTSDGRSYFLCGRRGWVEWQISELKRARTTQVIDNMRGGPGGAVGYLIGGEEGSDAGAMVDGLLSSVGGAVQARNAPTSTPTRSSPRAGRTSRSSPRARASNQRPSPSPKLDGDIIIAENQGPYDPQRMRQMLEKRYPGDVSSTTVPARSTRNVRSSAVDLPEGRGVGYDQRGLTDFSPYMVVSVRVPSGSTPKGEMRAATRALRGLIGLRSINAAIRANRNLKFNDTVFNVDQLRAIRSGSDRIPGYTWDHVLGTELRLVPRPLHSDIRHVGSVALRNGR